MVKKFQDLNILNNTMKIVIISDTHGNTATFKKIVEWVNKENIKTILHCGDIGSPESLKESLANFKGEFLGIFGNMDKDWDIRIEEYQNPSTIKVVQEPLEIELDGKKIAVIHKLEPAKQLAESGKYDIVFYGHTHKPWLVRIATPVRNVVSTAGWQAKRSVASGEEKGCLLINPGEAAGQIFKPTFAVYDTEKDSVELKIVERL